MTRESRSFRAEGIVLRRRNIGEADSVFVVFGEHEGKFEGIARGIRKARSRMRGHLEPLTFSRFLLAKGRSLDVFTQAETIRSFPGVTSDLDRLASASYLLELVDRFSVEHAENRELFHLLYASLEALNDGASSNMVSRYFELHLLAVTGFDVYLDGCATCGERLPQEETLLTPLAGGLVCRQCRPSAGIGRRVSVPAIKALRYARRCSLANFLNLRVPGAVADEVEAALGDAIRYHLERDLRTARFVHELASRPEITAQTAEA